MTEAKNTSTGYSVQGLCTQCRRLLPVGEPMRTHQYAGGRAAVCLPCKDTLDGPVGATAIGPAPMRSNWVLRLNEMTSREFVSLEAVLRFADDNGDALAILFPRGFDIKRGDETSRIVRVDARHVVLTAE